MRTPRVLQEVRGRLSGTRGVFSVLCVLVVLIGAARLIGPRWSPFALQVGPLVAAALLLPRAYVRQVIAVIALTIVADSLLGRLDWPDVPSLVVVGLTAAGAHVIASRRDRLGLPAMRTEAILVELRDRLLAQGEIPALPSGWEIEVCLRSAGGAAFAGDFVSSSVTRSNGASRLELSLVDVSGKGVEAGSRALLLSGALGGLLGAVEPERFLVEANRYLLRQEWPEGFATAVHVTLDLHTGEYVLESAGHPPAVHFEAGSGHWRVSPVEGPLLGVLPEVSYIQGRGMLGPGDALLIYTDGLVEVPGRDLDVGLDRLLGAAERLVLRGGFAGGAQRLVDEVAAGALDDRALLLVWRT